MWIHHLTAVSIGGSVAITHFIGQRGQRSTAIIVDAKERAYYHARDAASLIVDILKRSTSTSTEWVRDHHRFRRRNRHAMTAGSHRLRAILGAPIIQLGIMINTLEGSRWIRGVAKHLSIVENLAARRSETIDEI